MPDGGSAVPWRPYFLLHEIPVFSALFLPSLFAVFWPENAHYARARVYLYIRSAGVYVKKSEKKALKSFAMSPEVRTFALANERNAPPHK